MQAVARAVGGSGFRERDDAVPVLVWLAALVVTALLFAIAWAERGANDAR